MSLPNVAYLRTPEDRFRDLPDFSYQPHYLQYGNLRIAYIDENTNGLQSPTSNETFLCLHGQPTWSYLYRKMIPILLKYTASSGTQPSRRIIVPDLLGFGRSDKPTADATYTYNFHRNSLLHLIRTLNLTNITLVVQDWGGLLGLTLPLAMPDRFVRLLVMNTTIATGQTLTQGFIDWRAYSNRNLDMNITALMRRSCRHLSEAEADVYNAPFPDVRYKGGVRRFPNLVMTSPEMEGVEVSKASLEFYATSDVFKAEDVFMACGMRDPVLGPRVMERLAEVWKNGCYYAEIQEGGHFLQEWGGEVAKLAIQVFEAKGDVNVEGVKRVWPGKVSL
jgi:haloalkane dehalogenase